MPKWIDWTVSWDDMECEDQDQDEGYHEDTKINGEVVYVW